MLTKDEHGMDADDKADRGTHPHDATAVCSLIEEDRSGSDADRSEVDIAALERCIRADVWV